MAGNKLKPLSPIALAIHTVDETIRDLRLKRQELVALLPKRRGAKKPDTIMTHPITGKKSCYVKAGKRYAERQRKKTMIRHSNNPS